MKLKHVLIFTLCLAACSAGAEIVLPATQPTNLANDLANVVHDLLPNLNWGQCVKVVTTLFIGARLVRKYLPNSGKLGGVLSHLALEIPQKSAVTPAQPIKAP